MCVTRAYQSLSVETLNQALHRDVQPTSDCMKYEWMRLGSFKSFPRQSEGRPIKLAKAGFVFTSTREGDDTVTCFTCGVTKNNWLKYEDPLQVHKDLNPRCHFINDTSENFPILIPGPIVYDKILKTLHDSYIGGNTEARGVNSGHDSNTLRHSIVERNRQQITPINNSEINDYRRGNEHQHTLLVQIQPEDRLESDLRSRMLPNESMSSASVVLTGDSTRQTMVVEEARLRTFGNWPRYLAVRPAELARAGFYYLGSADRVQCAFCRGILRDWEEAENPVAEHWRYFSSCEFLRGTDRSNVPIIPNDSYIHDYVSTHPLSSADEDVRTATILKTSNLNLLPSNTPATIEDLGIITEMASFPNQAILATRVATFANWPRRSPIPSKEQIAEAGFYYLGREDAVQCFFCAGVLKSWKDDDIPWKEHAKWFPKCPYLLRIKGEDFVHSIRNPDSGTARIVLNNGATDVWKLQVLWEFRFDIVTTMLV
ncbi:baculoviral IAP repeat-containing protein 2 isoform X2 [Patella vulgata]|uniref:baculoviral IAP repeat-containing protein 2 isoform X2 n=1 Tax=Patella vulgata TaxID=6465 RepID=UPI0024A88C07|nr:baculoviral IAP repeat-containing protein 2 isoform X2 [Patella vulgata]